MMTKANLLVRYSFPPYLNYIPIIQWILIPTPHGEEVSLGTEFIADLPGRLNLSPLAPHLHVNAPINDIPFLKTPQTPSTRPLTVAPISHSIPIIDLSLPKDGVTRQTKDAMVVFPLIHTTDTRPSTYTSKTMESHKSKMTRHLSWYCLLLPRLIVEQGIV